MSVGFIKKEKQLILPITPDDFTNSICYGQTGSGKTSGFILPNIDDKIEKNHGVLIYDFKGNLSPQVKILAQKHNKLESVYEIGKPWGVTIDLLDGITSRTIQAIFDNARVGSDSYWTNSARDLFENIYKLLNYYNKAENILKEDCKTAVSSNSFMPKVKHIYSFVKSPAAIVKFFQDMEYQYEELDKKIKIYISKNIDELDKGKRAYIDKVLNNIKKSKEHKELLSEYHDMKANGETGGKNGVLHVLSSVIMGAAQNDYFNGDNFDIVEHLNQGAIIIINVQDANDTILNMLNLSIYQKLNIRTITKEKTPITIFIDEAQKVLSPGYLPDVDICRENKFEYVFSSQDYALLENKLGQDKAYELLRNVTTQFSFKTSNKGEDTDNLMQFEYMDVINKRRYMTDPYFFQDAELFDIEHEYQKKHITTKMIDVQTDMEYILVYSPILIHHEKIILRYINGEEEIVELMNQSNLVDLYLMANDYCEDEIRNEDEVFEGLTPVYNGVKQKYNLDFEVMIQKIVQKDLNVMASRITKYTRAIELCIESQRRLEKSLKQV
jgi:hypothetical protein